jgi:hypothetical protein
LLAMIGMALAGQPIRSGAFLIGDCPYYASAAVSLWVDHDLDLRNQLKGGLAVHHGQVAAGRDGAWAPKHPVLLAVLGAPFYAALGIPGFLILNLGMFLLLGAAVWWLGRRFAGPGTAAAATLLLFAGSFLPAYIYNFSPDLLSTLLVLLGVNLVLRRRNLSGGAALGLAVLAKITNLFTAGLVLAYPLLRPPRRDAAVAGAGVAAGVVAWGALNVLLFSAPTLSGYDRTLDLEGGEAVIISHRGFFDVPLAEGLTGQLFSPRVGLLPTAPVVFVALLGWWPLWRRRPGEAALLLILAEFSFLLFSTYRGWPSSHYGNRFLMVPVGLCVAPLAAALDWLREAWRRPRGLPVPAAEDR